MGKGVGRAIDKLALYLKLAERWQGAAHQATNETLKACYAGRAARYREMAASARNQSLERAPSPKAAL
jgi:hypothetical protein